MMKVSSQAKFILRKSIGWSRPTMRRRGSRDRGGGVGESAKGPAIGWAFGNSGVGGGG